MVSSRLFHAVRLAFLSSISIVLLPHLHILSVTTLSFMTNEFLSFAATSPHEFIITGDFNIHLDNPTDHLSSQFLSLLSSFNLTQHVNFPTHNRNHTLDSVISSSDTSLTPSVSTTLFSPSDHFPVFTELSVNRTPLPPPTSHSFRRLHSVDIDSFLSDLNPSQLVTNPPDYLDCLLTAYNSTLSSIPDKLAPVIITISNRKSKSNPWFSHTLRAFRTTLRHAESIYNRTLDWSKFKSLRNRYHHLILDATKQYLSKLLSSSSDNHRRLCKTVNKLLNHESVAPLPFSSAAT